MNYLYTFKKPSDVVLTSITWWLPEVVAQGSIQLTRNFLTFFTFNINGRLLSPLSLSVYQPKYQGSIRDPWDYHSTPSDYKPVIGVPLSGYLGGDTFQPILSIYIYLHQIFKISMLNWTKSNRIGHKFRNLDIVRPLPVTDIVYI